MKHNKIPKAKRMEVYQKFGGHCAYCGCKLEYKDMLVDHLDAVYRAEAEGRTPSDSMDNFNPSCRMCNFYKGTLTIEEFRKRIQTFQTVYFPEHFHTRLAHKYGMMPFKMATTTTSWTRMVVRKGSNLKTHRYFGIFKNQPISHFLQMREVRDVGEMRKLHRPEPHQHISQRL